MTEELYFFDTYALIEVLESRINYAKFVECKSLVTKLNLFELCFYLYRTGVDDATCKRILSSYRGSCVEYGLDVVEHAAKMKICNRSLSMTDCIGYQVAQEYGIKFLTGDKEFENVEGVEYVK
jgi:uncharacterized protein